jgi:hypothetical protein
MDTTLSPMARAFQAQMDMLRWNQRDKYARMYADAIVSAFAFPDSDFTRREMTEIGANLHVDILAGDTYVVTKEIGQVLQDAAKQVTDFTIVRHDLPSKAGFVWLDEPIVVKDTRGNQLVVQAFGWEITTENYSHKMVKALMESHDLPSELGERILSSPMEPVVGTLSWTKPDDPRDHMHEDWKATSHKIQAPHGLISIMSGIFQAENRTYTKDEIVEQFQQKPEDGDLLFSQFFYTFLHFINQPYVVVDTQTHMPRPMVRRAQRLDFTPRVSIVHLRRSVHHGSEPSDEHHEWSHRWIVRGHWRKQWYPSLQIHQPVWIHEHIKGPDGAPLIVKEKMFSVER